MLCAIASTVFKFMASPNVGHSKYVDTRDSIGSRTITTTRCRLTIKELLQQPDEGTKCPFPGIFLCSLGMPAMLLANICTAMGLVNGTRGTIAGIIVDPTGMYYLYIC